MQSKIIEFLASFDDREYHEINSFIKTNYENLSDTDVRQMLQRLSDKKRIEFNPNKSFNRWGLHTKIPEINTEQNTMADYDNWPAMARLTWEELEKREEDKINEPKTKATTNIQNIEVNNGIVAQESDLSDLKAAFQPIITPPTVQKTAVPKQGIITSIGKWMLNHIVAVIIAGLILAFIIYKLGWNK